MGTSPVVLTWSQCSWEPLPRRRMQAPHLAFSKMPVSEIWVHVSVSLVLFQGWHSLSALCELTSLHPWALLCSRLCFAEMTTPMPPCLWVSVASDFDAPPIEVASPWEWNCCDCSICGVWWSDFWGRFSEDDAASTLLPRILLRAFSCLIAAQLPWGERWQRSPTASCTHLQFQLQSLPNYHNSRRDPELTLSRRALLNWWPTKPVRENTMAAVLNHCIWWFIMQQ